ncbi:MAG: hypothetical protein IJ752_02725 [Alphaproteobacteria bacterium]|nr:hypothetical protein [Alphaproteobacteria bacterium]
MTVGTVKEGYGCSSSSQCATGWCIPSSTYTARGKTAYPSYAGGSVCGMIGSNYSF